MLTVRIARWSAENPWRAIGAWLLFVAITIGAGSAIGTKTGTFSDSAKGELATYQRIVDDAKITRPASENVLISAKDGAFDQARGRAAAEDLRAGMKGLGEVASVSEPVLSPRGSALLVNVDMNGEAKTADERVKPLLDKTSEMQQRYGDLRLEQVGGASMERAMSEASGDDFAKAELISIPLTLLIMLIAFGAIIAAGVPVLLAMSAVGSAIGLAALVSQFVPATQNTNSMILLIGMAVGVDYSLFYIRREREERAKGKGHLDAVEIAAATSGHAIVVSGIAVVVAMAGLFVANDVTFTSMAIGAILVVLVAMIGSITVLPAALAKLGRWVDKPRIPVLWRLSRTDREPRFWNKLLRPTLRRPAVALAISLGALLALAVPALGMKLSMPDDPLPDDLPISQSEKRMAEEFPSTGATHAVVVKVPADKVAEGRAAVTAFVAKVQQTPGFAHDRAPKVMTAAGETVAMLQVPIPDKADTPAADASLAALRTQVLPTTIGTVAGAEYAVSGQTAGENDFLDNMNDSLPLVIAFVLVLTFIMMLATFRAPVIALTSIVLNLLSAAAAYGVLTLVFQGTWAESLLGFDSIGSIVGWLPLMLFVILFGLSMDYHIFVVSRIREAHQSGLSTRDAVARGITSSAGSITSAAAVMIGVFSIFATLSTIDMKQMGVGLATAILIDATLIRAVVLPSLMIVLGKANWWTPKWLRRKENDPPTAPMDRVPELAGAPR
ncbi:MMPL family transporter [Herbihabitans rhizosphaerae]|nr:MMPL family transporter [Herbihabitans rhizosphaerae]